MGRVLTLLFLLFEGDLQRASPTCFCRHCSSQSQMHRSAAFWLAWSTGKNMEISLKKSVTNANLNLLHSGVAYMHSA